MATQLARPYGSLDERRARGEQAASQAAPGARADWEPAPDRADPVDLLMAQNRAREADLVPVRHGRMMTSAFAFYRGAAKVMAADLAGTPTAGLVVQLCGDAHMSNFGGFASPERQLVFGLNDFDETLPGPFEYDLLRMAVSFTIAARHNEFTTGDTRTVTCTAVQAYRQAMADFAGMRTLDVWYAHMSEHHVQDSMRAARAAVTGSKSEKHRSSKHRGAKHKASGSKIADDDVAKSIKAANKSFRKARSRDSLHALKRYAEIGDGGYHIVSQPPVVVPSRDLAAAWGRSAAEIRAVVDDQFHAYQRSLSADRRQLLERFTVVDVARKVVGVGSVGTRAFMVLLQGRDTGDPLFLQVKEATRSVLEEHLPRSRHRTPGQRVVEGQKLMQSASDIFLGWTTGVEDDRFYYWRQLRDMKVSAAVEAMTPFAMTVYARMCGWTLAHAHARSGDPVAISAYLGTGDEVDLVFTEQSARYADQNARDHRAFVSAVESGRIEAVHGV